MALVLRTAVDGEMLQTCVELVIFLRAVTLKAVNDCTSHDCSKIRILAISLLSPSPARVTEDIDIRSPYRESVITLYALTFAGNAELDSLFGRSDVENLLEERIIPAGSHTDGLRENGSQTIAGRSVQSLIPPIIIPDA
jgi:hypothetical protein